MTGFIIRRCPCDYVSLGLRMDFETGPSSPVVVPTTPRSSLEGNFPIPIPNSQRTFFALRIAQKIAQIAMAVAQITMNFDTNLISEIQGSIVHGDPRMHGSMEIHGFHKHHETIDQTHQHKNDDFSGSPKIKSKRYSSKMKQNKFAELLGYFFFIFPIKMFKNDKNALIIVPMIFYDLTQVLYGHTVP